MCELRVLLIKYLATIKELARTSMMNASLGRANAFLVRFVSNCKQRHLGRELRVVVLKEPFGCLKVCGSFGMHFFAGLHWDSLLK